MRYLVSSYDVFNALGSVRAGALPDVGGSCCTHACAGHECQGHLDVPNYTKPAEEKPAQDFLIA